MEIGTVWVIAIIRLIPISVYIPIALATVSFVSIWLVRDNCDPAVNLLRIAVGDSVMEYTFAAVPLFAFMGLIVSKPGLGAYNYGLMSSGFRRVKGGIGMATVGANASFAAVTGSSIASASVFLKVSVPTMMHLGYNPRFAVGVVAGSSVLGMIIPHSAMPIIYSFMAEQSVGDMFLAGLVRGLMLPMAYIAAIWAMGRFYPAFVRGRPADDYVALPRAEIASKTLPTIALIGIVLGDIHTGWLTQVEAGALAGLVIAVTRRRMSLRDFRDALP
ncbi:MAG: TRAP transporter large permease subunit, partial [Alphaproteobacteria bacterium]|nr:TRAP transporter large permease subunit [Alphaproteobacteria bacterium]